MAAEAEGMMEVVATAPTAATAPSPRNFLRLTDEAKSPLVWEVM
jgi:hypothetical protein